MNGLSPTPLVSGVVPRFPMPPKKLPNQTKRPNAFRTAGEDMKGAVAVEGIKTALKRNIPTAANAQLIEGNKVLI